VKNDHLAPILEQVFATPQRGLEIALTLFANQITINHYK
jgi:hypothetical protein